MYTLIQERLQLLESSIKREREMLREGAFNRGNSSSEPLLSYRDYMHLTAAAVGSRT